MSRDAEWIEPEKYDVDEPLQAAIGGHPLVSATLQRRGIHSVEAARAFLDSAFYRPAAADEIPNLSDAVLRVRAAIDAGEAICVWGDFDVDGQTATTVLVEALRDMGAEVSHYIPVRQNESHGVHVPSLEYVIEQGISLLLTCDTGISAHAAVDYANSCGVDVIVTDHHDLPEKLPDAAAIVNPKMLAEDHPLRNLPGVGVAYKLIEALDPGSERIQGTLDLVALGIVADLALLYGDVRYLLQRGLDRIRNAPRLSLRALMEVAGVPPENVTEEQIGFILAPRLNALGRLSDANSIVDFLTTTDEKKAKIYATELEGLNARRRLLCDQVTQAAMAQIEADPSLLDHAALVVAHEYWPTGVVGIVASSLVEHYHRPALVLSIQDDGSARGSARSIEGVDISAAIASHKSMLESFGGHPMAAGLAIEADRIGAFRQQLGETVAEYMREIDTRPQVVVDAYAELKELTLEFAGDLERLAPFGPGNPQLVLASKEIRILEKKQIGRAREHLSLVVGDSQGETRRVIWWGGAAEDIPQGAFDMAYHLRETEYRGQREVQLTWVDARRLEVEEPAFERRPRRLEYVDFRREVRPLERIKELQRAGVQIWCEGNSNQAPEERSRYELSPAEKLAIWTPPAGLEELHQTVQAVSPRVVYLFSGRTDDDLETFIKTLTGMVKFALRKKGGRIDIWKLAAATAQREFTVHKGIAWLIARGDLDIGESELDELTVIRGSGEGNQDIAGRLFAELQALLEETAAFRRFYKTCAPERLFDN
jgi:single-stranded-DNA-specific exonuclease